MPIKHTAAFPWSVDDGERIKGEKGMTLRDYFAARAMSSLMDHFLLEKLHLHDNDWMAGVAMDAYSMADAMLKERQK